MMVTDLEHFADMSGDAPAAARRLAGHLADVVRAATAGDLGVVWVSALPCRRRSGRQACPGRLAVRRPDEPGRIEWRCTDCGDEGVISGWEGSPYDLRRRTLSVLEPVRGVVVSDEVAGGLRELSTPFTELERVVYGMRVEGAEIVLAATYFELAELISGLRDALAPGRCSRRHRQRFEAALQALDAAAEDF